MAQAVKDAELVLSGLVLSIEELFARQDGEVGGKARRAGDFIGRKVVVLTSGSGFAVVKVDDIDSIPVESMEHVVWIIRNAAYDIGGNSGMSTKFLREATEVELVGILAAHETIVKRNTVKS